MRYHVEYLDLDLPLPRRVWTRLWTGAQYQTEKDADAVRDEYIAAAALTKSNLEFRTGKSRP